MLSRDHTPADSSPSRPRLLFLSHRLPFPTHNGAAIRTYNLLRELSAQFEIALVCFDRSDATTRQIALAERIEAFSFLASVHVFPIPQQGSHSRLAWDHVRSVVSGRPYTWYVHDSPAYITRLRELLAAERFDAVHLDSMDLVRMLPIVAALPIACTHHNVESELLARRAPFEKSRLRAAYLHHQARRLERAERYWLTRIDVNIAVSQRDADSLRALAPRARVVVVPNGVDVNYFRFRPDGEDGCVFVGGTSWFPNRDALEWFTGEVLPALRRLGVDAPVTWVGRCTPQERTRYDGVAGLRMTGYVDDIRPYLERAACFIAPLRVGGGTRLKLLDAWAAGKAIVSTRAGAEGLDAAHDGDLLLADSADEFAGCVASTLADAALRRRLGTAGRARAERDFSWPHVGARLAAELRAVCGARAQPARPRSASAGAVP